MMTLQPNSSQVFIKFIYYIIAFLYSLFIILLEVLFMLVQNSETLYRWQCNCCAEI